MGIDYGADIGIGYIINLDDLLAPFRVETEEKFHLEDRFDQKTGKKLEPAKVVDVEAGEAFVFEGQTYEEGYELYEAMAEKLNCSIQNTGGYTDGETLFVTVHAEYTCEDGCDGGRFFVGSSFGKRFGFRFPGPSLV